MMTITERMEMIRVMTNSLSEAVVLYDQYKTGEYRELYKNSDILPPTKNALERRATLLREELLRLTKDIKEGSR